MTTPSRPWWIVEIQGLTALTVAVLALVWSHATVEHLRPVAGLLILLLGLCDVLDAQAVKARGYGWRAHMAAGIVAIAAGLILLGWTEHLPRMTRIIGLWALLVGLLQWPQSFRADLPGDPPQAFGLAGLAGVIVGIRILTDSDGVSAMLLLQLFGIVSLAMGLGYVIRARALRNRDGG